MGSTLNRTEGLQACGEPAPGGGDDEVLPREALPLAVALEERGDVGDLGPGLRVAGEEGPADLDVAEVPCGDLVVATLALDGQDLADWHDYGVWMRKHGLVDQDPHADDAVTNEFLPGQGLEANTAEPQSSGG